MNPSSDEFELPQRFSPEDTDILRALVRYCLGTASRGRLLALAPGEALRGPDLDNFRRGFTPTRREKLVAIYVAVGRFLFPDGRGVPPPHDEPRSPNSSGHPAVILRIADQLYAGRNQELFDNFGPLIYRRLGVPTDDVRKQGQRLRGIYAAFRYGARIRRKPTNEIVRSGLLIELEEHDGEPRIRFRLFYPRGNIEDSRQVAEIEGIVLPLWHSLFFLGVDKGTGLFPSLWVTTRPPYQHISEPALQIKGILLRRNTGDRIAAARMAAVRLPAHQDAIEHARSLADLFEETSEDIQREIQKYGIANSINNQEVLKTEKSLVDPFD